MGYEDDVAAQPERFRTFCVSYARLKADIQLLAVEEEENRAMQTGRTVEAVGAQTRAQLEFSRLLETELAKVNRFTTMKHETVFSSLRGLCGQLGQEIKRQAEMNIEQQRREQARRKAAEDGVEGAADLDDGNEDAEQQQRELQRKLMQQERLINEQVEEVHHLDSFVRLNFVGFRKIVEKFDACMGITGGSWFVQRLPEESFCKVPFDGLLILLSLTWARYRQLELGAASQGDATWVPPESFIRRTQKYWVKLEEVIKLKTRVLRHMPYLIFGASEKDQEKLLNPFAQMDLLADHSWKEHQEGGKGTQGNAFQPHTLFQTAGAANMSLEAASKHANMALGAQGGQGFAEEAKQTLCFEEAQMLSSIYFDGYPHAPSFQERILRHEGARLVRFRWYGRNDGDPDQEVFIELKTHHEAWLADTSAKTRFSLPQKHIFSYMKGTFDIDAWFDELPVRQPNVKKGAAEYMRGLAKEVNAMVQERNMQPLIRTSYFRSAFQLATSNEVRVSLDTQMCLLNEFKPNGHPEEPWCRVATDVLAREDVYQFPCAILEVKLQDVAENPPWVTEILKEVGAVQVHKFSKFQHAMCFIHPEIVPAVPHWIPSFKEAHERARKAMYLEDQQPAERPRIQDALRSADDDGTAAPWEIGNLHDDPFNAELKPHPVRDMQLLEPKVEFAAERTFLHYIEGAIEVAAIAQILLLHDQLRPVGLLMIPCLMAYVVWSFWEYRGRVSKLHSRTAITGGVDRLDVEFGPAAIATLCGIVVLASMAIFVVDGEVSGFSKKSIFQ